MKKERDTFFCECHTPYHLIVVEPWDWPDDPQTGSCLVQVSTDNSPGFFRRAWQGLKHAFGRHTIVYGDVILDQENTLALSSALNKIGNNKPS